MRTSTFIWIGLISSWIAVALLTDVPWWRALCGGWMLFIMAQAAAIVAFREQRKL